MKDLDRFNPEKEVIYEVEGFAIALCAMLDPVIKETVLAYGIYNTETGVREAESRRFDNAKVVCDYFAGVPAEEDDGMMMEQMELPVSVN